MKEWERRAVKVRVVNFHLPPSNGHAMKNGVETQGVRKANHEDAADEFGVTLVCCIYHKERAVGGSSSEDDSDDSSSSLDDNGSENNGNSDDGRARMGGGGSKRGRHKGHSHRPGEGCGKDKTPRRKKSPNAYEKMPKGGALKETKK